MPALSSPDAPFRGEAPEEKFPASRSGNGFDDLTFLAAQLSGASSAFIRLLDGNREWSDAKAGLSGNDIAGDLPFCNQGLLRSDVMVVEDAFLDQRFPGGATAPAGPQVRFFAGCPLVSKEGVLKGMFCVADSLPHHLSAEQKTGLELLGGYAAVRLDERLWSDELNNSRIRLEASQEELRWTTAFFEAQAHSSLDGIVVVNQHGVKTLQNQRTADLFKMPPSIAAQKEDAQLDWVMTVTVNPREFLEKVVFLYSHPEEISRDEIELKDGTVLERYSSPVVGKDKNYYGRIWTFRDISERRRAENELEISRQTLRGILDNIPQRVFWKDRKMVFLGCNRSFAGDLGYQNPDELIGKTDFDINLKHLAELYQSEDLSVMETDSAKLDFEQEGVAADGSVRWLRTSKVPLHDKKGKVRGVLGTYVDVTDFKLATRKIQKLEAYLSLSQKMELVGKLAGGIAHEFNSILTSIIGESELLLENLPPGGELSGHTARISKAAGRAANLTRQLLAYGRKQFLQPEIVDLKVLVDGMEGTFRHLMGAETDIRIIHGLGSPTVKVDAGQIEQVIINICINSREAMPQGGKLTIETASVIMEPENLENRPDPKEKDYVMLAITDTGAGMTPEVRARVFEPFFTTKEVGEGTGLGLSSCYGIIKQSGGNISVYSEPGHGAVFKIYLPRIAQEKLPAVALPAAVGLPRGTETVLLVEDDPALRDMAAVLLRRLGYTVWTASNGVEALELRRRPAVGPIDLLLTDVIMPHMNGRQLSEQMKILYPKTRILFTSAYTANAVTHQGVLDAGVHLLQKPFTPSQLAAKLRQVLD